MHHILIVDDDTGVSSVISSHLPNDEFKVIVATSAKKALQIIEQTEVSIDTAFIDLWIPVDESPKSEAQPYLGIQLADQIYAKSPNTKLIALSIYGDRKTTLRNSGRFADFIEKDSLIKNPQLILSRVLSTEYQGLPMDEKNNSTMVPTWVLIIGAIFGLLTLIFLMALVFMAVLGKEVPCNSRFLVAIVLSFGASLSTAFLGGTAAARGNIPLPFAKTHPVQFSVTGGIAVLILIMLICNYTFIKDCGSSLIEINCSEGYQSFTTEKLKFGFCYPRQDWELDKAAIEINAADIFIRSIDNRDISAQLHVSMIPPKWENKHEKFIEATINTWKQVDPNLTYKKVFLAGRKAYQFNLFVKDRKGRLRPTEVTSTFLTNEKLLDIFLTWFNDTDQETIDTLRKIRSTIVMER